MSTRVVVRYVGPDAAGRGGRFVAKWNGKQRTLPYNHALSLDSNYRRAVERAVGDCSIIEEVRSGRCTRVFDAYLRGDTTEGIEKVVCLGTAHMPSTDPEWGDLRVVKHEWGFIVFVDENANAPEWMQPIMEWALAMETTLILFDSGAPRLSRFRTWEW